MTNDAINGSFELMGALVTWLNVRRLWVDRHAAGVNWYAFVFYSVWGLWNLHYYPALGQRWSFLAGVALVAGNLAWLMVFWSRRTAR